MAEPHLGSTAFMITVSPMPGKYDWKQTLFNHMIDSSAMNWGSQKYKHEQDIKIRLKFCNNWLIQVWTILNNEYSCKYCILCHILLSSICQGRIQTIPLGGHNFFSGGMYFGWTNEGAKRPRIEGEAQTEDKARDIAGGGVWGGGSVSPSPENFWKFKLETVHFGA